MTDSSIAWFGVLGAVIGAVPSFLGTVGPWLKDRDKLATDKRALEVARIEVDFISAWIDAASKFPEEGMETHKALARERLARLLAGSTPAVRPSAGPAPLAPRVKGRGALLVYLGFYCFLLFGASIDDTTNDSSLTHLIDEAMANLGVWVVFSVPLVVLFFRWRRSLKRSKEASGTA